MTFISASLLKIQMRPIVLAIAALAIAGCSKTDAEKQKVIDYIKLHAQDPSGLEILEWGGLGPINERPKLIYRLIRFRCKVIAYSRDKNPIPVSSTQATVFYMEGTIVGISFSWPANLWDWGSPHRNAIP